MASADPISVVLQFEEAINSRNPDAVVSLMTDDSVFVDSLGNKIQGTAKLKAAWAGYFKMVPDYSVSHTDIFGDGNIVAVFGAAQGTFAGGTELSKENFWQTPAAWRAIVKEDKIAVWQVFADNEPIRAIMRKKVVGYTITGN